VNQNNPGMNRILAEDKDLPFKKIEINTLDNILFEKNIAKVDFIKLDVEGLSGAKNTLQSKPLLFIELDDSNLKENNKSAKELIALLISFGYTEIHRADNLIPVSIDDDFADCHYDIIVK
jgi:Methyltransferase FkbM domain